jgi:hydroxyethylthiazole kinase-like uncharacterized protein yjeF
LAVGGSRRVPGVIALTGEAAFRVGAGKVRIGTVESAAIPLGLTMPEAGMVALPETAKGEIASDAAPAIIEQLASCDALVFGPAMAGSDDLADLVEAVLGTPRANVALVLDAAVMTASPGREPLLATYDGRVVMTPNRDEMAGMLAVDRADIDEDPVRTARAAAARFGAVIVLKDRETFIAAPSGQAVRFESPCAGLGTAGSGDVLAGIIGGLLARGADPLAAAAWAVWLHGQAGAAVSRRIGETGFLARELLPELPRLVCEHSPDHGS